MNTREYEQHEHLNKKLNDESELAAYKAIYDTYKPSWLPRVLGCTFTGIGNLFYGKKPTYLKFRALEIIARVPYHAWDATVYSMMTFFFFDEVRALKLSESSKYARFAQDNETMHIIVMSRLAVLYSKVGIFRGSLVPIWFAFFYYWWAYVLYFFSPRMSYELNFMFESHAYEQYEEFLEREADALRTRTVDSQYLAWYGREHENQYGFFRSVLHDELIHRNESIEAIERLPKK